MFVVWKIYWQKSSQLLFILESLCFIFIFEDNLAPFMIFGWQYFFFEHLKFVISLFSGCQRSHWGFSCYFYCASPVSDAPFFSLLVRYSFHLIFSIFTMMCLFVNFFVFILFELHWAFWICNLLFFHKLEKSSDIISLNISVVSFSSLTLVLSLCVCWWA